MRAFYLHGARDLRPSEVDVPGIEADQVLVRVLTTGICGSDQHYYAHGRNGDFVPERPFILGHESAGEVVDAGAFAGTLPLGSRVAIDPSHPCHICSHCRRGHTNLCPNMRYFGSAACTPPMDGSFREYVPVPATGCHIIPDTLSYDSASLLEPLAIALHGVGQAGNVAGRRVLVTGAGPIGQLIGMVAKQYGAARLAVSDVRDDALQLATRLWADTPIRADDAGQMAAADRAMGGFDVVIEASGAPEALATAYERCKAGGTIVQLGTQPGTVALPVNAIMQKEITVRGSFRFAHDFAAALDLVASEKLDLQPLISHRYSFDQLIDGVEAALDPGAIKVLIDYS